MTVEIALICPGGCGVAAGMATAALAVAFWAPHRRSLDGVLISVIEHVSCVRCGVLAYGRRLPMA
jgi:hypothetical protein